MNNYCLCRDIEFFQARRRKSKWNQFLLILKNVKKSLEKAQVECRAFIYSGESMPIHPHVNVGQENLVFD